jgi:hypothetical protein
MERAGIKMSEQFKCPTCSGYIPNNENIGAYAGAISRKDNKTEICSACGTKEAMEDFFGVQEEVVCPQCDEPTSKEALAQWEMCHDCDNQMCVKCGEIDCDHEV